MKDSTILKNQLDQYLAVGDDRYLDIAFRLYSRTLFSFIYLQCRHRELTEDIIQNTFIRAQVAVSRGQYKDKRRFLSWLARIAKNLLTDHYRGKKKLEVVRDQSDNEYFLLRANNEDQSWLEYQVDREIGVMLKDLIVRLPEEQKDVVIMRLYLQMPFREIADVTGVSINTALGRMRYALITLRRLVKKDDLDLDGFMRAV